MATKRKSIVSSPKYDPSIPRVAVEIGDETFELVFDWRAFCEAKSRLQSLNPPVYINILRAIDFSGLDIETLPGLLYAAAYRYQPDLTWEHVNELVNFETAGALYIALANAYMAAVKDGREKNPPKAAKTTPAA